MRRLGEGVAGKGPGRTVPRTERPGEQPPPVPFLAPAGSATAAGAPGALRSTPPNCPRPPVPGPAGLCGPGAQDSCGEGSPGGRTQTAPCPPPGPAGHRATPKPRAPRLPSKERRGFLRGHQGPWGPQAPRMCPRSPPAGGRLHRRPGGDSMQVPRAMSTKERLPSCSRVPYGVAGGHTGARRRGPAVCSAAPAAASAPGTPARPPPRSA